jgi:hypothetical protein
MEMLKLLGFHFQAKGASLTNPYVMYPHWNRDELLIPSYDALRAITGKMLLPNQIYSVKPENLEHSYFSMNARPMKLAQNDFSTFCNKRPMSHFTHLNHFGPYLKIFSIYMHFISFFVATTQH